MGFKEVSSLDADNAVALGGVNKKTGKKNPTSVEGYYLGKREVESKRGKSNLHFLQTPKGNLGLWGKTDLDRKLAGVNPGTMIRATHVGMQATPNGEMYKYKVEVDSDNTIEVTMTTSDLSGSAESLNDSDDSDTDAYASEAAFEDDSEDYVPAPAAAASLAERQAKVRELLSKGKK